MERHCLVLTSVPLTFSSVQFATFFQNTIHMTAFLFPYATVPTQYLLVVLLLLLLLLRSNAIPRKRWVGVCMKNNSQIFLVRKSFRAFAIMAIKCGGGFFYKVHLHFCSASSHSHLQLNDTMNATRNGCPRISLCSLRSTFLMFNCRQNFLADLLWSSTIWLSEMKSQRTNYCCWPYSSGRCTNCAPIRMGLDLQDSNWLRRATYGSWWWVVVRSAALLSCCS